MEYDKRFRDLVVTALSEANSTAANEPLASMRLFETSPGELLAVPAAPPQEQLKVEWTGEKALEGLTLRDGAQVLYARGGVFELRDGKGGGTYQRIRTNAGDRKNEQEVHLSLAIKD